MATNKTEELNLTPAAKKAADLLLAAHPGVKFTSGRRNAEDQARAMAGNVVTNRKWIQKTYKDTPQRAALQAWVDANPGAKTKPAIAAGLLGVMSTWSDVQKGKLSRHFSGNAFDIQPVAGPAGKAIIKTIKGLPKLRQFLEKEGGLVRWHADFG
jgi:hypothetical protein